MGQRFLKGSLDVVIVKEDTSVSSKPLTYLWAKAKNKIIINQKDNVEVLSIWTDNGIIDSTDDIGIIPTRAGFVTIYEKQHIQTGELHDTVIATKTFKAINRPPVVITIDAKKLSKKKIIVLVPFDTLHYEAVTGMYQVVGHYDGVSVTNKKKGQLTVIEPYQFNTRNGMYLRKGNVLHFPAFSVKDVKTDLIFRTTPFDYKIE